LPNCAAEYPETDDYGRHFRWEANHSTGLHIRIYPPEEPLPIASQPRYAYCATCRKVQPVTTIPGHYDERSQQRCNGCLRTWPTGKTGSIVQPSKGSGDNQ